MRDFAAFVLGAGLGTRLRPLTDRRPKPLVPLFNKPLITFAFDHLLANGARRFVVNTHHCPAAYPELLGGDGLETVYRGSPVTFRHEPVLLETGGGIRNVADLLGDEPFVVYNGDVLADFPLGPVLEAHAAGGNLATLVLRSSGGPLHVQCEDGRIVDFRGRLGRTDAPSFLFTGVSVLSPEIFREIPKDAVVSIIPIYLDLIQRGVPIGGVVVDEGLWLDLGEVGSYLAAHEMLANRPLSYLPPDWISPVHADAKVAPDARVDARSAIGAGATIGEGAVIESSVIWEGARIAPGAVVRSSIVCDGASVTGHVANAVIAA